MKELLFCILAFPLSMLVSYGMVLSKQREYARSAEAARRGDGDGSVDQWRAKERAS
ncbi:hypothetical protein ACEK07_06825 [Alcanivoracaceae bacterium MT1]